MLGQMQSRLDDFQCRIELDRFGVLDESDRPLGPRKIEHTAGVAAIRLVLMPHIDDQVTS